MGEGLQQNLLPSLQIDWSRYVPDFSYLSTVSVKDVIDILLVAYLIYRLLKFLRGTSAERLVKGILVMVVALLLATGIGLTTITYLLQQVFVYGIFVLVVIFQPELRRLLESLGKGNISRLFLSDNDPGSTQKMIGAVVSACRDMAETKTGALIVCERAETLGEIERTGTKIDAEPSAELIKNIFYPKSPLHDGAMIVRGGRVQSAGCVLPLSGNQNLSRDLGTRHRAAVGMSENADSVLVVVSEETGAISVAIGGMLKRHLSPETLQKVLENELLDVKVMERSRISAIRKIWKGGEDE